MADTTATTSDHVWLPTFGAWSTALVSSLGALFIGEVMASHGVQPTGTVQPRKGGDRRGQGRLLKSERQPIRSRSE